MARKTLDAWQTAIAAEAERQAHPELVVGVVTPVGTNTSEFISHIKGSFAEWSYTSDTIKLSDHFDDDLGTTTQSDAEAHVSGTEHEDQRILRLIEAGNDWCRRRNSASGVAPLAVALIRASRMREHIARGRPLSEADKLVDEPLPRHAYILHSLKRPGELELLRWVYGERFIVFGTQSPPKARLDILQNRLRSHSGWSEEVRRKNAQKLIDTDAKETDYFGQDLARAYTGADIFVGEDQDVGRPVAVLFGDSRKAPSIGEYAMFLASATAARSLTASRRVGAAIVRDQSVIALGMNDVPSVAGQTPDAVLGYDYSEQEKATLMAQTMIHLTSQTGWLEKDRLNDFEKDAEKFMDNSAEALRDSPIANIIEFQRAVHAEMWALMDAARRGVAVDGAVLYGTTYPCHLCWKHVFASGIKTQYYIDIYPKSRAENMYASTSSMLQPFVGIAPHRYVGLFKDRPMAGADALGNIPPPDKETASPLVRGHALETSVSREQSVSNSLEESTTKTGVIS